MSILLFPCTYWEKQIWGFRCTSPETCTCHFVNKKSILCNYKNRWFVKFMCSPIRDLVGACTYHGFANVQVALIKVPPDQTVHLLVKNGQIQKRESRLSHLSMSFNGPNLDGIYPPNAVLGTSYILLSMNFSKCKCGNCEINNPDILTFVNFMKHIWE